MPLQVRSYCTCTSLYLILGSDTLLLLSKSCDTIISDGFFQALWNSLDFHYVNFQPIKIGSDG